MWSVVEKTALAEAEIEYADIEVDTIFVKFPMRLPNFAVTMPPSAVNPVEDISRIESASVVIWTTTPWTIPGNRAISYSSKIQYSLYQVTTAPKDNWAAAGEHFILADKLAEEVMKAIRVVEYKRLRELQPAELKTFACAHPLAAKGYEFSVPLLDGDHVTDDAGTGFVHTAPSHGADDYNIWIEKNGGAIPMPVNADGLLHQGCTRF